MKKISYMIVAELDSMVSKIDFFETDYLLVGYFATLEISNAGRDQVLKVIFYQQDVYYEVYDIDLMDIAKHIIIEQDLYGWIDLDVIEWQINIKQEFREVTDKCMEITMQVLDYFS